MGVNSRHRLDTITKAWRVTTSSLWRVLVASTNAIRRSVHAVHNLVVIAQPWGILFAVVGVGIAGLSLLIDLDDRLLDRKYRAWTILLQVSSQTTATTRASLTGSNTEDGARSQEIIHGRREGTGTSVRGALEDSILDGADLGAASMIGAQLDGASMRATVLGEANLEDSFFGRADVTDADFEDTNLTSADLSEVSGLTESQLRDACADPKRPPKLPIGFSWQPTMCEATAERFQGCPGHEHWKKEYEPL